MYASTKGIGACPTKNRKRNREPDISELLHSMFITVVEIGGLLLPRLASGELRNFFQEVVLYPCLVLVFPALQDLPNNMWQGE